MHNPPRGVGVQPQGPPRHSFLAPCPCTQPAGPAPSRRALTERQGLLGSVWGSGRGRPRDAALSQNIPPADPFPNLGPPHERVFLDCLVTRGGAYGRTGHGSPGRRVASSGVVPPAAASKAPSLSRGSWSRPSGQCLGARPPPLSLSVSPGSSLGAQWAEPPSTQARHSQLSGRPEVVGGLAKTGWRARAPSVFPAPHRF